MRGGSLNLLQQAVANLSDCIFIEETSTFYGISLKYSNIFLIYAKVDR